MAGDDRTAKITKAYREHRPYLVDLAFRMLGDIGAAEDTVQDAFARLLRADIGEIDDERGWLIVVTSRLCLDRIKSARARRERALDPVGIELAAAAGSGGRDGSSGAVGSGRLADPADRVTLDDGVSLALLVVLQQLTPAERVVFVLHDMFQMPFPTVAQTVGRTQAACRQLAKRARDKVAEAQVRPGARSDVSVAEHRAVTERFIAACAGGDLNGLLAVLAPDAWGEVDLGPGVPALSVTHGAALVAGNLLRFWGPPATLVSHPVGGQPALLAFTGGRLAAVIVLVMRGEVIQAVQVIADPRKLSLLRHQLAPLG
jgi:RNA polymerase sigma-70 factor, ECF subfamily